MYFESHQTLCRWKATYTSPRLRGYGAKAATRLDSRQTPPMRIPTPTFLNLDHVLSLPRLLFPRVNIHIYSLLYSLLWEYMHLIATVVHYEVLS